MAYLGFQHSVRQVRLKRSFVLEHFAKNSTLGGKLAKVLVVCMGDF